MLLEAWRKGDDARLEQEVFGELARDPSLAPYYELFYFDRNDRMAQSIAERVDAGGRWFVAVGAGHVVGARGIPSLLSQHGYRVRRVIPKTPCSAHVPDGPRSAAGRAPRAGPGGAAQTAGIAWIARMPVARQPPAFESPS